VRSLGLATGEFNPNGAQPVGEGPLREAALIISADRLVSSCIIRWDPAARSRLFTLKEAAALGHLVLGEEKLDNALDLFGDRPEEGQPIDGLDALVAEMDAARGWLPIERPTRTRFGLSRSRQWSKAFDVPDAHSGERVSHGTMFGELQPAAELLADAIISAVDRSAADPKPRPARA
jgi:protein-tyrosine phosphatase